MYSWLYTTRTMVTRITSHFTSKAIQIITLMLLIDVFNEVLGRQFSISSNALLQANKIDRKILINQQGR